MLVLGGVALGFRVATPTDGSAQVLTGGRHRDGGVEVGGCPRASCNRATWWWPSTAIASTGCRRLGHRAPGRRARRSPTRSGGAVSRSTWRSGWRMRPSVRSPATGARPRSSPASGCRRLHVPPAQPGPRAGGSVPRRHRDRGQQPSVPRGRRCPGPQRGPGRLDLGGLHGRRLHGRLGRDARLRAALPGVASDRDAPRPGALGGCCAVHRARPVPRGGARGRRPLAPRLADDRHHRGGGLHGRDGHRHRSVDLPAERRPGGAPAAALAAGRCGGLGVGRPGRLVGPRADQRGLAASPPGDRGRGPAPRGRAGCLGAVVPPLRRRDRRQPVARLRVDDRGGDRCLRAGGLGARRDRDRAGGSAGGDGGGRGAGVPASHGPPAGGQPAHVRRPRRPLPGADPDWDARWRRPWLRTRP